MRSSAETKSKSDLEIVPWLSLGGILAETKIPEGWELMCNRGVCVIGRYVVGALIHNPKTGAYSIMDEYDAIPCSRRSARNLLRNLSGKYIISG